ncbi:hypothetical protein BGZ63DRAFT_409234 [Mariannaea sp. PMI_226]|nr:hypothetical protein BGZ63DRAFT_409234 [Mariannaea sp. PMI_226]
MEAIAISSGSEVPRGRKGTHPMSLANNKAGSQRLTNNKPCGDKRSRVYTNYLEGKVGELVCKVGELVCTVKELVCSVKELVGKVGELVGKVGELESKVGELEDKIGELEGLLAEKDEKTIIFSKRDGPQCAATQDYTFDADSWFVPGVPVWEQNAPLLLGSSNCYYVMNNDSMCNGNFTGEFPISELHFC